jgi:5-methylcytosine-specific restriction endonuclease McrA
MAKNKNITTIKEVKASLVGFNGTNKAKGIFTVNGFIDEWKLRRSEHKDECLEIFKKNEPELRGLVSEMVMRRVSKRTINGKFYRYNDWVPYQEYLNSVAWHKKKKRLFKKVKPMICERCRSTKDIHVHHKIYKDKKGNSVLFEEKAHNLIVLCRVCHEIEHSIPLIKQSSLFDKMFLDKI